MSRSAATTAAPSAAHRSALARPIPDAAPVMTITLPRNEPATGSGTTRDLSSLPTAERYTSVRLSMQATRAEFPPVGLLYRETRAAMPLLELAAAAEERGFDCVMIGEHTHIPVSREAPWPAGGELPEEYSEFPDP